MSTINITSQSKTVSTRKAAIIVGASLLAMAITAMFSYGIVLLPIIKNEATSTVETIKSSALLFRLGIVGWLVILVLDVVVAWALFVFFKPENKNITLLTSWLRLVYTLFLAAGILCLVVALLLSGEANHVSSFSNNQLNTLVQLFLTSFITIWTVGLVMFGLHLAVLSYLVIKHPSIHNAFGLFLAIAAISYIAISIAKLVAPEYNSQILTVESILSAPMAISEIGFAIWLLIKGGKTATRT
jgi:hypothetical protein